MFLIFLATYIIWHHHRAKFNHELDEATSEAAKASVPAFLVDDVHRGAEGGVYSDTSSHEKYAQQPMSMKRLWDEGNWARFGHWDGGHGPGNGNGNGNGIWSEIQLRSR
ncbi:hypothetical protein C0995_009245, partial [Termitomyces sp. Mi166